MNALGVYHQSITFVLQSDKFANGCWDQQSARNQMILEISYDLLGAPVVAVLLT